MLTEEQVKEIKEQLFKQIATFPEEQRENARSQIEAMNEEQLEEFLEKNKLVKDSNCIFCSIIKEETPSYKIAENNEAVAILDINPVSQGHALVLPKEHKSIDETTALQLAQEIAKKLKYELGAEDVKLETTMMQGHGIINIIPVYKNKKLERKKAEDKELANLQKKLKIPQKTEEEKPKRKLKIEELPKAPKRIP